MSPDPNKKSNWALVVSILALLVSLASLMLGPAIVPRIQAYFHMRTVRENQMLAYLRYGAVLLDGMRLFIAETWAWGPNMPYYSPPGVPDTSKVMREMPAVGVAIADANQLYSIHIEKRGEPYYSKNEALWRFDEIKRRFWEATKDCLRAKWPWQWRSKMEELQKLKVSDTERERILNLKRTRQ